MSLKYLHSKYESLHLATSCRFVIVEGYNFIKITLQCDYNPVFAKAILCPRTKFKAKYKYIYYIYIYIF